MRMFSLALAWLGEIVKSKLRKLRAGSRYPVVLLHDGQHSFSLLGTNSRATKRECPFPVEAEGMDRHNWRVLP